MPEFTANWHPRPPEMLELERSDGPTYLYECAGIVPADADDEGDLVRVWVPDPATPYNTHAVDEVNEKHGVYAERAGGSHGPYYKDLDGFVRVTYENTWE